MTREEATNIMKVIVHMLEEKYDTDRVEDAVDMAIKALEQEPKETWSIKDVATTFERHGLMTEQEPCEDCISRADARHLIAEVNRKTLGCISTKAFKTLYKGIEELPSVTPKPKTEVLDKIRAEIEQTVSRYSISRECGCIGQVEWSDRLIKESEVLQILDKYKAESEE